MRAKWLVVSCCLLVVMFVASGCAAGTAPSKSPASKVPPGYEKITLVGSTIGSAGTTACTAIGKILIKHYPEIQWSSCSGAAAVNVIQLTEGAIKLAMMVPTGYVDGYGWEKVPQSRLRSLISPLSPMNYLFLVPGDRPWKDITEVPKGLNLCPGPAGTTIPVGCEAWLKFCGLKKEDFNWLPMAKSAMADAWRSAKVDLCFTTIQGAEGYLMDMMTSPRKPRAMGLSEAQLAKAKAERTFEKLGFMTPVTSNLKELMPELFTYEVYCPQNPYHLASRDDFPAEIAYKMAKILDEHHEELVEAWRSLRYASPQQHMKYVGPPFEIHPGVLKYYKEKGYLK